MGRQSHPLVVVLAPVLMPGADPSTDHLLEDPVIMRASDREVVDAVWAEVEVA